jgi:hypothetical protein
MARVLADDALADELRRNAGERVSSYTLDAMADAFEAAVEGAIAHGRPSRSAARRLGWRLR